jgi:hypothetical protein
LLLTDKHLKQRKKIYGFIIRFNRNVMMMWL